MRPLGFALLLLFSTAFVALWVDDVGFTNSSVFAQEDVPEAAPDEGGPADEGGAPPANVATGNILQDGWWGPGFYFSAEKLFIYIFIFVIWLYSASWMNADMERLKNPNRDSKNAAYVLPFTAAAIGGIFIPVFWISLPLWVLLWFVPLVIYVTKRNKPLPPHEKVWTVDHIKFVYATWMNKIGVKVKIKKPMVYEVGPAVDFDVKILNADKKTQQVLQSRLILARNAPGYNLLRQHVFDAIDSRATSLMIDFTVEKTTVRHQIDGVWLDLPPFPRVIEKGKTKDVFEEMLDALKVLVGANPADRRSQQKGEFLAILRKKIKFDVEFISQGTPTGEAVMLQFIAQKVPFKNLDQFGMRPAIQEKLLQLLNSREGFIIVAAPPANGLRSSMDLFSRFCDRFTRDVVNVEDVLSPSEAIENVILVQYDSSKGETPMKVLPDVIFKEPHCLIVRDMSRLDVLQLCCNEVENHRLFITMTRAKDGVEALYNYLRLKIPPNEFIPKIAGVITQRLIRKVCPDCKEGYVPDQRLLTQLGLHPDQVKEFYRKRTPLPPHEERKRGICPTCNGIGYIGRTALFEFIEYNETMQQFVLANLNEPNVIRQQIAKAGQTGFMHEGIHLLLKGETTVDELSRVMKM